MQENIYSYGNVSPRIDFGTTWTNGPLDNSPAAPIGQGLAAFLLGRPTGGGIDRNASSAETSRHLGVYIQDDWKLTRKLTLNLGLRYDYEFATVERFNRSTRGFDFSSPNPIESAARANYARSPIPEVPVDRFRAVGGLLFAGLGGVPRSLYEADGNNFSPRIGLAYQLRQSTVIRAGYGIFFEPRGSDRVDVGQQGFSRRTSLVPSLDNGLTFQATLRNPFPDGILEPVGAAGGLATFLGQSPSFLTPTRKGGYVQRWSLDIQQELPSRVLIDLGYLGNRGVGLGLGEDLNAVPAQYLSNSPLRDNTVINYLSQAVTNPFFGLPEFAGTGLSARTVQRAQLLRAYPHFAGVNTAGGAGFSWYHSLQVRAEKRFSRGYTVQGSYTWSKFMEAVEKLNPSDTFPHRVISSLDRTHSLAISGIYELPLGRGRRWLSSRAWMDHAAGGWSIQAIYQGTSGRPLNFGNILFIGNINDIALPNSERAVERWFNTEAGFVRDSRLQLASNIRTFPLRLAGVRSDGFNICNISVIKNFRLSEKVGL